jgi:phosphoglycolate phosphatase-like HAD superfamily hydrolase
LDFIEDSHYLDFDEVFPGMVEILQMLKRHKHNLAIITNRKHKKLLEVELLNLGLSEFFDTVLLTEGNVSKEKLIKDYVSTEELKHSYLISDGEEDFLMAEKLGMKAILVSYGTRSKEFFLNRGIKEGFDSVAKLQARLEEVVK